MAGSVSILEPSLGLWYDANEGIVSTGWQKTAKNTKHYLENMVDNKKDKARRQDTPWPFILGFGTKYLLGERNHILLAVLDIHDDYQKRNCIAIAYQNCR
jgi:hypothetical protein